MPNGENPEGLIGESNGETIQDQWGYNEEKQICEPVELEAATDAAKGAAKEAVADAGGDDAQEAPEDIEMPEEPTIGSILTNIAERYSEQFQESVKAMAFVIDQGLTPAQRQQALNDPANNYKVKAGIDTAQYIEKDFHDINNRFEDIIRYAQATPMQRVVMKSTIDAKTSLYGTKVAQVMEKEGLSIDEAYGVVLTRELDETMQHQLGLSLKEWEKKELES